MRIIHYIIALSILELPTAAFGDRQARRTRRMQRFPSKPTFITEQKTSKTSFVTEQKASPSDDLLDHTEDASSSTTKSPDSDTDKVIPVVERAAATACMTAAVIGGAWQALEMSGL